MPKNVTFRYVSHSFNGVHNIQEFKSHFGLRVGLWINVAKKKEIYKQFTIFSIEVYNVRQKTVQNLNKKNTL